MGTHTQACPYNHSAQPCTSPAQPPGAVASGTVENILTDLVSTHPYLHFTASVPCMAFYDVKNARFCNNFAKEELTHREPILDDLDFERFVGSAEPILQPGRDIMWVLAVRSEKKPSGDAEDFEEVRFG